VAALFLIPKKKATHKKGECAMSTARLSPLLLLFFFFVCTATAMITHEPKSECLSALPPGETPIEPWQREREREREI
jgi:hypothetical protein